MFIVAGLASTSLSLEPLGPDALGRSSSVVAGGMLVFLSYEGFELIANASDRIAAGADAAQGLLRQRGAASLSFPQFGEIGGYPGCDDGVVGGRSDGHRLLDEAVEQEASGL